MHADGRGGRTGTKVSQILKVGPLPINLQAGPRFYAEGPTGGPDWGFRLTLTLLFPK